MKGNVAAAAALALACMSAGASAQTSTAAPAAHDADYHNRQQLYLLGLKASDGWMTSPSGLRYRRIKGDGTGPRPTETDTAKVHYTGTFIDGTEFDSSIARGEPADFPLRRLIKGSREGLLLMGVGDTYEFALPAEIAYGRKGRGIIPGGATLLFTMEVLGILPPAG